VASAAFLVALWRISARLLRPGAALFVLLLGATSPFFVHYGQQARMYSLIAALTVLSVLLLLRLLDEPDSWSRALIWGVSCTALQWSQYVAALVILPQLAAICRVASPNRPRLLAVGALAMASVLPWFVAARLARPVTVDVGAPWTSSWRSSDCFRSGARPGSSFSWGRWRRWGCYSGHRPSVGGFCL
jgi:uncharacterized membrane protein